MLRLVKGTLTGCNLFMGRKIFDHSVHEHMGARVMARGHLSVVPPEKEECLSMYAMFYSKRLLCNCAVTIRNTPIDFK